MARSTTSPSRRRLTKQQALLGFLLDSSLVETPRFNLTSRPLGSTCVTSILQAPSHWLTIRSQVDDVAQAFYTAIVEHKSGRYLIASETRAYFPSCRGKETLAERMTAYDNQLLANFARKVRPDLQASIPLGKPDEPTPSSFGSYSVDSKKSQRELRIQYKGLEEMVGDVMDYFVKIGAVKT